ncbi:hypothetical protein ElyMa_004443600 [Elysia marginata]|uniref:Uncharacterized protein n=1 Tax=Elysia marginata TaxID=1093978 RepID=A0AAV4HDK3_9GAST|nr:hypothetical protein ElyMa_004443600 [Elysia marginata]
MKRERKLFDTIVRGEKKQTSLLSEEGGPEFRDRGVQMNSGRDQNCAVTLPNPRGQLLWEMLQIRKQVKEICAFPSSFTEVKPLLSPTDMTAPVSLSEDTQRNPRLLPSVAREEKEWLDHVSDHLTQEINKRIVTVMGCIP